MLKCRANLSLCTGRQQGLHQHGAGPAAPNALYLRFAPLPACAPFAAGAAAAAPPLRSAAAGRAGVGPAAPAPRSCPAPLAGSPSASALLAAGLPGAPFAAAAPFWEAAAAAPCRVETTQPGKQAKALKVTCSGTCWTPAPT